MKLIVEFLTSRKYLKIHENFYQPKFKYRLLYNIYYIIYIKNFINFIFINRKDIMIVTIDYFLLLGFCLALAAGLFLGLKSIKLI